MVAMPWWRRNVARWGFARVSQNGATSTCHLALNHARGKDRGRAEGKAVSAAGGGQQTSVELSATLLSLSGLGVVRRSQRPMSP
jgi:hypothetical protein